MAITLSRTSLAFPSRVKSSSVPANLEIEQQAKMRSLKSSSSTSEALLLPLLLAATSSLVSVGAIENCTLVNLTIGYITGSDRKSSDVEYPRPGMSISGALTLALRDLETKNYFNCTEDGGIGVGFQVKIAETFGLETESVKQVIKLAGDNVSVILGPQETCLHEAVVAASQNVPMISYFCSDEAVSNKKKYSTFTRTKPPDTAIIRAVTSLLLKYEWTSSITIVYPEVQSGAKFRNVANSLQEALEAWNITSKVLSYQGPYYHQYEAETEEQQRFEDIVAGTKDHSRIYVMVSEYFEHLGLLMALEKFNLPITGEYLVIGVALDDHNHEWDAQRYLQFFNAAENQTEVLSADSSIFKAYLGIVTSPTPNFSEFSRQVSQFNEQEPFRYTNFLKETGVRKKVPIEAAYLYDAVTLYAKAVKSIIRSHLNRDCTNETTCTLNLELLKSDLRNGSLVSANLRNVKYDSATGVTSETDENGDAAGNFTLIAYRDGAADGVKAGLYPVGVFAYSEGNLPELRLNSEIDWIAEHPPVSEPRCGFYGEKCKDNLYKTLLVPILSLAFFIGLCTALRYWLASQELQSKLWKINESEIRFETGSGFLTGRGSHGSLARFGNIYATLVTYKGRFFAVKTLNGQHADGCLRNYLQMVREVRHENLNAVIGACVRPHNTLILQDYCSRGSIKDILENSDIKLDNMFVSSLAGDLLRGLSYLHESSAFRIHGNLKPSNCLVDSRWVLKLSDFGWFSPWDMSLCQNGELIRFKSHSFSRLTVPAGNGGFGSLKSDDKLQSPYTPPELLSNGLNGKLEAEDRTRNIRRGDIYSLGVILWELIKRTSIVEFLGAKSDREALGKMRNAGRRVPFWHYAVSALQEELYDTKRSNDTNAMTFSTDWSTYGVIAPHSVLECLRLCLENDPELRPDIKALRIRLRPLHRGINSNIFDTMINLMEKYANNLEILVDNRTQQLHEEKRKTEQLLYEMIPPAIADELKEGLHVPAQTFNSVSVYFSDIVGFTAMSAVSTPLEVIEFLNDLYTSFDAVIENFDVYKIETIGDAYMVASGLPVVREGNFHAVEMAALALALIENVKCFRIRHRPDDQLRIRIGIHCGPCCAGIVGQKRPRYCLFGDTVNTASRMESTGLPQKIHCSEAFVKLISTEFETEERGIMEIKGKGPMKTFWLVGRSQQNTTTD